MMNDEYRVLEVQVSTLKFGLCYSSFRIHHSSFRYNLLVMLNLQQRLNEEWKTAMRNKDALRRDTLSGLRAAIKRAEIDARASKLTYDDASGEHLKSNGEVLQEGDNIRAADVVFDDAQSQAVIEREAKKRRDSIDEYSKANRDDLAQKERDELAILADFLPQQFTDEELDNLTRAAIAETGATSAKDMGAIMKAVMPRVQGRADGKRVNEAIRRLLQ